MIKACLRSAKNSKPLQPKNANMITWNKLDQETQLDEIIAESKEKPVLIFKHSTTCPISGTAKDRLERQWGEQLNSVKPYYLDLLSYRPISNKIAQVFEVQHESPQVLLIRDGACVYNASHLAISAKSVEAKVA